MCSASDRARQLVPMPAGSHARPLLSTSAAKAWSDAKAYGASSAVVLPIPMGA